jgi:drug/metabolite transporter (DMT)-like permease
MPNQDRTTPNHSQKLNTPRFPPAIVLIIGVAASSTSSIFIRYAQSEAPSLVIAAYRLCLATLILIPILASRHRSDLRGMSRGDIAFSIGSGIFLSIHFATWITSLEYTSVASSVVLVQTAPLFVTMLAPILLHERPTKMILIGLSLTLLGSVVVGASDLCTYSEGLHCPSLHELFNGTAVKGDLLALAGAIAAAGYLLIGRVVRKRLALIPYITLTYGTAACVLIALMLLRGHQPFGYSPMIYLWFILLALLPQLLAHSTYNWALRYLPAAVVSLTLLGEPVGSTILAYFFLAEIPTLLRLVGAVMILVGLAIVAINPKIGIPTTGTT